MQSRFLVCAILFALILPRSAAGQSDTFDVVAPWVVAVIQPQPDGKHVSLGSGFIAQGGYVVTAAHVIAFEHAPLFLATQGRLSEDRMRPARVVYINRDSDIAILDAGYSPTDGLLHEQTPADPGDSVSIFGYEFLGDSAAILRLAQGSLGQKFQDAYQPSGPIQPGFSGGPVTTRGGRVVGIVDLGSRANFSLAYIVPDTLIREALARLPLKQAPAASASIIPLLPETRPATPSVIRDTTVVPGQRLGPLTFATPLSQIGTILGGPPDLSNDTPTGRNYTWRKYGIAVFFDTNGLLVMLGTWNPVFSTAEGIRVGASIEAVERAYGLNYQTEWAQNRSLYSIAYRDGLIFVVNASNRAVAMIAIGKPSIPMAPSAEQGVPALTGTYIGDYTATAQPGAIYEGVFQITQNGRTIAGSITTNSGRSGNIVGVVAGNRINATMTFTDACRGQASALIDIVNGGQRLVGNYTVTDCLGTYSGGFVLNRQ